MESHLVYHDYILILIYPIIYHQHHHVNFFKFITVGTPVQNNPKELMSLLCFLMPLFSHSSGGSKGGYDDGEDTSSEGGGHMLEYFVKLEKKDGGGSGKKPCSDEEAYGRLKKLLAPFVLRRKKIDVLGQLIPAKVRDI